MLGRRKEREERKERKLENLANFVSAFSAASAFSVLSTLRRIAGMPDYERHVEHLRRCHPERPIPTEREFYEEYLRDRYADGPTRCC